MNNEFPQLNHSGYQFDFLKDWWSPRKLFRGNRTSGKTTLMVCEARRFSECGFDIVFIAPKRAYIKIVKNTYQDMFGEKPLFDFETVDSIERGILRGTHCDVVIFDEMQQTTFENINREIIPTNPMFFRASACNSTMHSVHWLSDADGNGFFDSVYED